MKKYLFPVLILAVVASVVGCDPAPPTTPTKLRMRRLTFIYNGIKYKDSLYYTNGGYPIIDSLGTGIGVHDSLSADRKYMVLRSLDQYEPILNPDEERPHQNPARLIDIFLTSANEPIYAGQRFTTDDPVSKVEAYVGLDMPFPTYSTEGSQFYKVKNFTIDINSLDVKENLEIVELHGTFSGTFENAFGSLLRIDSGKIDIVK